MQVEENSDGDGKVWERGEVKRVMAAACSLVCEWAQGMLSRPFNSLLDLSHYLVTSSFVSSKTAPALTIMAASDGNFVDFLARSPSPSQFSYINQTSG